MREVKKRSSALNQRDPAEDGRNPPNKKTKQAPRDKIPSTEVVHPLHDPKLFSKILDYATTTVSELKVCRQVCKVWKETTFQKWRDTAVLKIVPDTPLFQRKLFKGISTFELYKEIQDPQSNWKFKETPFSRYKLKGLHIDVTVCDEIKKISGKFWQLVGPLMKYVYLEKCTFDSIGDKPFIQFLVTKLPNLRDLVLSEVGLKQFEVEDKPVDENEDFEAWEQCHKKLRNLTVMGKQHMDIGNLVLFTPELETITGVDRETGQRDDHDNLVSELTYAGRTLERNSSGSLQFLPNLRHLDLMESSCIINYHSFGPGNMDKRLRNLNLKLSSITAALKTNEIITGVRRPSNCIHDGSIDELIHSQAETLQKLEIFRAPIGPPLPIFLSLPETQMTALTELHLWGAVAPSFHFLKSVPNLKVLNVNLGCFEKRERVRKLLEERRRLESRVRYQTMEDDMAEITCPGWMEDVVNEHLDTLITDFAFPAKSLRMMGKWMPNLKVIKTILDKKTVPIVCEQWKELKELACLFSSKIDNFSVICSKKRGRSLTIGDLKYLEKFQLDSSCGASHLSNESVFNGFLKMPALKSIQICVSKEMSANAENTMKKKLDNCRVIRNYDGGDHSNYNCCEFSTFAVDCAAGMPKIEEERRPVSIFTPSFWRDE